MNHDVSLIYAGIGSRRTPSTVLVEMYDIARTLAKKGWTLRSGGADGADTAFEQGCDIANGVKEIFLPWKKFNNSRSPYHTPSARAAILASVLHPAWNKCVPAAQLLHSRNCHQILGETLTSPVKFVICWTPQGRVEGGTATAIKLAKNNHIPIINLATDSFQEKFTEIMSRFHFC